MLRGRDFTASDTREAAPVVIVSQGLMRRTWNGQDPIGKRISIDGGRTWATVVGVAGDARQQLDRAAGDDFYSPVLQTPLLSATVLMKASSDPVSLARQVREAAYAIDAEQPIDRFRTLADVRADALARPRQTATLLAVFAGLALIITATGLAGVVAFSVNQRTQEFGVRMALGAPRTSVLRLVVGEGLRLVLIGLAIGVAGAWALTRVLADLLYGIEPTDAVTFLSVSLVLLAVALLACFLPARRAASVDPLVALRTA
jgi:predicted permease